MPKKIGCNDKEIIIINKDFFTRKCMVVVRWPKKIGCNDKEIIIINEDFFTRKCMVFVVRWPKKSGRNNKVTGILPRWP